MCEGCGLGTFEPDASGRNNAWYIGSNWRSNRFRVEGSYTDIDEDFNPAVGICQTYRHPAIPR